MGKMTFHFGVFSYELGESDYAALKSRFRRNPLFNGPCLIINRDTGLALDAGPKTKAGDHNTLWSPHAAPWQQWRLRGAGGGQIEIVSESSGLCLTTMATGYDWGETWLDRKVRGDWSKRWTLKATDDGAAFLIQNASSGFALDAGENAENGRDPHLWKAHRAPWQQWIVARLPLT